MDHKEHQESLPGFIGSVLLSNDTWDRETFIRIMKQEWDIEIVDQDEEGGHHHDCCCGHDDHEHRNHHEHHEHDDHGHACGCEHHEHGEACGCGGEDFEYVQDDTVYATVGDLTLVVSMMPLPVPNGEAEYFAGANFMWKDGVEQAKKHRAHILVAVMGEGGAVERATLFTKVAATLLQQKNALAIYTDGAVFEPKMYRDFAEMLKEGQLCIPLWAWFGLYFTDEKVVIYTYGLRKFGKEEMEFLIDGSHQEDSEFLNAARYYLMDIANYVIASDVVFHDGETLGVSEDHHLLIRKREAVAIDGMSLQMEYEPA
ncbi:MAG: DUF4261 domain-containing protein [Bacillota bacterium]|nr:DUF4261 domain-containing protein [Bacillota bacterium]